MAGAGRTLPFVRQALHDPQQLVALLKSSCSTKLPAMAQISAIGATIPERLMGGAH